MAPHTLPPFDEDGNLNVIIETPKGSRNKFKWEEEKGLYSLAGVLPQRLLPVRFRLRTVHGRGGR